MALIRWQPFNEMNSLQRDLNRLFEALAPMEEESNKQMSFMPLAEMEETEDSIHLRVEIPGMDANNLDVQVTKEAVMIRGDRKSMSKSEKNGMTRSEFRYGKFSRTIPLPTQIDNNNVNGDYKDGILSLNLPKAREENKVIKVNLGSSSNQSISESQSPQKLDSDSATTANTVKSNDGYDNSTQDSANLWNDGE